MSYAVTVHYDNGHGFASPYLWVWYPGLAVTHDLEPVGHDADGPVYAVEAVSSRFSLLFKDGPGTQVTWEESRLERRYTPTPLRGQGYADEVWVKADKPFLYDLEPARPQPLTAPEYLAGLPFRPGTTVPDTDLRSGLGATLLADGRMLFGLYHPNAARVFVLGSFNDWQRPGADAEDPARFIELDLYEGYFGLPNLWLGVTDRAQPGQPYQFMAVGAGEDQGRRLRYLSDPLARELDPNDFRYNNPVIVDPLAYPWATAADAWQPPAMEDLILYELSVYGFTADDADIPVAERGTFRGLQRRIEAGYFDELGVTALSLMPLAERPGVEGPGALGYDPVLPLTVERDYGRPDDLRAMVEAAHAHGLAVLVDQVFNHTGNQENPLWQAILERPDELDRNEGGLYFSGTTPWGNRLATEQRDVQNLLIDACKLWLGEYRVDGFRFDATHTSFMDHGFLQRLADELQRVRPGVLLVAENLPNQGDLDRRGFDGFAQWCDGFHDKLKALLREGPFGGTGDGPDGLADVLYFSKSVFAAHTNNTVNYVESHDEHSVAYEAHFSPQLDQPAAKERKARLGLFTAAVALGQPMLYMGQEFGVERERNRVDLAWPTDLAQHGFYQWTRRLLRLRRRYPGLKLHGYNPADDGRFAWLLGPWMDASHGGGQRVAGWRASPNDQPFDDLVVLLNFENHAVRVDLELGRPGRWVKLADIDTVDDLSPDGGNGPDAETSLRSADGRFAAFDLPSSSGFIYKWAAP